MKIKSIVAALALATAGTANAAYFTDGVYSPFNPTALSPEYVEKIEAKEETSGIMGHQAWFKINGDIYSIPLREIQIGASRGQAKEYIQERIHGLMMEAIEEQKLEAEEALEAYNELVAKGIPATQAAAFVEVQFDGVEISIEDQIKNAIAADVRSRLSIMRDNPDSVEFEGARIVDGQFVFDGTVTVNGREIAYTSTSGLLEAVHNDVEGTVTDAVAINDDGMITRGEITLSNGNTVDLTGARIIGNAFNDAALPTQSRFTPDGYDGEVYAIGIGGTVRGKYVGVNVNGNSESVNAGSVQADLVMNNGYTIRVYVNANTFGDARYEEGVDAGYADAVSDANSATVSYATATQEVSVTITGVDGVDRTITLDASDAYDDGFATAIADANAQGTGSTASVTFDETAETVAITVTDSAGNPQTITIDASEAYEAGGVLDETTQTLNAGSDSTDATTYGVASITVTSAGGDTATYSFDASAYGRARYTAGQSSVSTTSDEVLSVAADGQVTLANGYGNAATEITSGTDASEGFASTISGTTWNGANDYKVSYTIGAGNIKREMTVSVDTSNAFVAGTEAAVSQLQETDRHTLSTDVDNDGQLDDLPSGISLTVTAGGIAVTISTDYTDSVIANARAGKTAPATGGYTGDLGTGVTSAYDVAQSFEDRTSETWAVGTYTTGGAVSVTLTDTDPNTGVESSTTFDLTNANELESVVTNLPNSATTYTTISSQIQSAIDSAYDSGYNDGYADGYADGYTDGFTDGVNSVR